MACGRGEGREGARKGGRSYLDHIRAVVVEVPELAVVFLMRPPERVLAREGGREGGIM